jgi:hypothetical protein
MHTANHAHSADILGEKIRSWLRRVAPPHGLHAHPTTAKKTKNRQSADLCRVLTHSGPKPVGRQYCPKAAVREQPAAEADARSMINAESQVLDALIQSPGPLAAAVTAEW